VRVLEIGCGAGANLWFLAREGFCIHGVDGSETAVRNSLERLDRECPGWRRGDARVATGDFTRIEYPDAHFDAVIDIAAGCYVDTDAAAALYELLAGMTKPQGKLFCRTFESGCWGDGTGERVGRASWRCSEGPLAGGGAVRFTRVDDVPNLFRGWRVDRIERMVQTEGGRAHEIRHLQIEATRA
ncbi:MAG: class I SAM-dependent methyltransferase, partial [Variovorax sp.]